MITSQTFVIQGMDCANETRVIEAAVIGIAGVTAVEFDLVHARARIEYDHLQTSPAAIQKAIRRTGFRAEMEGFTDANDSRETSARLWFVAISGAALLLGFALLFFPQLVPSWESQHWAARGLLVLSALLSARFFAARAMHALAHRHADMNVLVLVAAIGAFFLGDWVEGAAVAFLFAVANMLESWSALRVRKSISRFIDLTPHTAERIDEGAGSTETIENNAIRLGDLLLVRPGSRIPADGTVERGRSSVDQSALTGEAIPLDVEPGAQVLAGSTNGESTLHMRATADAADSRASRVKEAISQAHSLRSSTERWVDAFSRRYTPLVLLVAVLVAVVPALLGYDAQEWFYNSLVLVLIACPCALVISTPVTIVSAVSALARGGVLVRGGESVERAASIRAVAFDKTGVLTYGRLRVSESHSFSGLDKGAAIRAAGALEQLSEHPVARAVASYAQETQGQLPQADEYRAIPGRGGEGFVDGIAVWVGSPALASEKGAWPADPSHLPPGLIEQNGTLVCVGSGDRLWLILSLEDSPRAGASHALKELHAAGVERALMLTGDRESSARRVAEAVGLSEFQANLLPEQKLAALHAIEAESGPVAMVGDGMNDAPAMAAASFSVATGENASNVALEASDAVIWNGDLQRVPWLFRQSRRAMAIVRQNVVIAIGSKLIFVILAFFGVATLWMAVVADVGATILVTFNGMRMLRAAQKPLMETRDELVPINTSS